MPFSLVRTIPLMLLLTACATDATDAGGNAGQPPANGEGNMEQPQDTGPAEESDEHVVQYTDDGYMPAMLTIDAGEMVTFRNESGRAMWTASDLHPTHREYSGTSLSDHCPDPEGDTFDACAAVQAGDTWSFTFTQAGSWQYHNHLSPSDTGIVTVR